MNRVAALVLGLVLLLDVTLTWAQDIMCPAAGQRSVPCDATFNCFMSCCLSSGACPTFSCASNFGVSNGGTTCNSKCQEEVACSLFAPDCPNTEAAACIGTVLCLTANCDNRTAGDVCLISGKRFKICSGL